MKKIQQFPIILALLVVYNSLNAQTSSSLPVDLSKAIIEKVLLPGASGQPVAVLPFFSQNDLVALYSQPSSEYMSRVQSIFGVTDPKIIRALLTSSSGLEIPVSNINKYFQVIKDTLPGRYARMAQVRNTQVDERFVYVYHNLVTLYNKEKETCLFYFNMYGGLQAFAVLQKKNNIWEVTERKTLNMP